jgi:hypothetical protein
LLALDAYNRHADPLKVKISENRTQISSQIGDATWQRSSDRIEDAPGDVLSGSKASGFSASTYKLDGVDVISYRGTDFPTSLLDLTQWIEFGKDIGAGWLQSFGVFNPNDVEAGGTEVANFQPYYALTFYEAVTGAKLILTDEEKKELIAAGQLVGALERQLETYTEQRNDVLAALPAAQTDLAGC